jgi:hypothetical protein
MGREPLSANVQHGLVLVEILPPEPENLAEPESDAGDELEQRRVVVLGDLPGSELGRGLQQRRDVVVCPLVCLLGVGPLRALVDRQDVERIRGDQAAADGEGEGEGALRRAGAF